MKNQLMENWLTNARHTFSYIESIPLDSVFVTTAAKENIRPTGKDEDTVITYAVALEQGIEFPAILVYPVKNGYEVIDGTHRYSAYEMAERKTLDAYVVQIDKAKEARTLEVLQRTVNTINGLPHTKDERIMHAVRIVALGYSAIDAARMMNLKPSVVSHRLQVNEAHDRAHKMNLQILAQETSMIVLNRLKNPDLYKKAITLAHAARLNSEQIKDLGNDLRDAVSDAAKMAVLETWQERMDDVIKETSSGKYGGPISTARRAKNYAVGIMRNVTFEKLEKFTAFERRNTVKELDRSIKHLQTVRDQLLSGTISQDDESVKRRKHAAH